MTVGSGKSATSHGAKSRKLMTDPGLLFGTLEYCYAGVWRSPGSLPSPHPPTRRGVPAPLFPQVTKQDLKDELDIPKLPDRKRIWAAIEKLLSEQGHGDDRHGMSAMSSSASIGYSSVATYDSVAQGKALAQAQASAKTATAAEEATSSSQTASSSSAPPGPAAQSAPVTAEPAPAPQPSPQPAVTSPQVCVLVKASGASLIKCWDSPPCPPTHKNVPR